MESRVRPGRIGWLLTLATLLLGAAAHAQNINTFAGGGSEEGVPAAQVLLQSPFDAAIDAAGNIYVLETGVLDPSDGSITVLPRVRKIAPDNSVTTVAGTGQTGSAGDGGKATEARFDIPLGIAVDAAGNLYISDSQANRIRRVTPDGIINNFAGGGSPADNLGDGGKATDAALNGPRGIIADAAGNVIVADVKNHRVRRIAADGTITTIAGNGQAGFSGDGGKATDAQLNNPTYVALDSAGNLFITDLGNNRIRKVDTGGTISTVAGNGQAAVGGDGAAVSTPLGIPERIFVDTANNLYIPEAGTNRIRRVGPDGNISTVAGKAAPDGAFAGDGGKATDASLSGPTAALVDAKGNLLILDTNNNRLRLVGTDGVINSVAGGVGRSGIKATDAVLALPRGGVRDAAGNTYIADKGHFRILKVDPSGMLTVLAGIGAPGYSGDGGPAAQAAIGGHVDGLAVDAQGNLYIPDLDNHRVRRIAADGTITTVAGNGQAGFSGDGGKATDATLADNAFWNVALDAAGNLYIADGGNHRVRKVDTGGTITTIAGNGTETFSGDGGKATDAGIPGPDGLFVDAAGNLFITDSTDQRMRKVDASGVISTIAGTGEAGFSGDGGKATDAQISSPENVAADAAGNVYFADGDNNRIRRIAPDGTITTIAGTGDAGFAGDNGPAAQAQLDYPGDLYIDKDGNLLIADEDNHRIRIITGLPR
jgi:trimeric autotransporter adhesin